MKKKNKKVIEETVKRRKTKLITVPKKKRISKTKETVKKEQPKKKYVSKKSLRRRRRFVLITSLVLILAIILTIFSCTVFFPIKTIKIVGNKRYSSKEICSSLGVIKGDNLLLASERRANNALKQEYNYLESVEFNKKIPFTLEVKVNEYKVFAQIMQNKKYYKISSDGKLLEISKKCKNGSPVVVGIKLNNLKVGEYIDLNDGNKKTSKISEIINAFENNEIGGITLINLSDMQDIRVTYKNRIVMLLGSSSNLNKKLVHAKATLEAKGNTKETGTLNLSRIPSAKNEASFIPRELEEEEIAKNTK